MFYNLFTIFGGIPVPPLTVIEPVVIDDVHSCINELNNESVINGS